MSRRCHTVRVDGHEKLLLGIYRTLDPRRRDFVDGAVWRLHTGKQLSKELNAIGADTLLASDLEVFVFASRRLETREYLPVINEGDPPPTAEHYEALPLPGDTKGDRP